MKVTTVRFGADLWRMLEAEAALAGVSTSQYIREAALARAAAAAAVRGEDPLELLAGAIDSPPITPRSIEAKRSGSGARQRAAETRAETHATMAEAGQAIRRSHELANQIAQLHKRPG